MTEEIFDNRTLDNRGNENVERYSRGDFQHVMGECHFDKSLSTEQIKAIHFYAVKVFESIRDADMMTQYALALDNGLREKGQLGKNESRYADMINKNSHAWLMETGNERRENALQNFGKPVFFWNEKVDQLTKGASLMQIRAMEEKIAAGQIPAEQIERYEGQIKYIKDLVAIKDASLSLKDMGLLRGINALKDDEGKLVITLEFCLTIDECPVSGQIKKMISKRAQFLFDGAMKNEATWNSFGAEMPDNLYPLVDTTKCVTPDDKSPYDFSKDPNQELIEGNFVLMMKPIEERIDQLIEEAK